MLGIYLYLIGRFQAEFPVYATNKGNSIILSITGIGLGIYMANRKFTGIYKMEIINGLDFLYH